MYAIPTERENQIFDWFLIFVPRVYVRTSILHPTADNGVPIFRSKRMAFNEMMRCIMVSIWSGAPVKLLINCILHRNYRTRPSVYSLPSGKLLLYRGNELVTEDELLGTVGQQLERLQNIHLQRPQKSTTVQLAGQQYLKSERREYCLHWKQFIKFIRRIRY